MSKCYKVLVVLLKAAENTILPSLIQRTTHPCDCLNIYFHTTYTLLCTMSAASGTHGQVANNYQGFRNTVEVGTVSDI